MAGANRKYSSGDIVFREGDPPDGMYLIRKGELVVFLERDGNEVRLATIGTGGMIGEMAFFEQKPRSASVKATVDTEVTLITPQDLAKLMRQIPKWFVGLMSSLSSRLRETNSRLQKLEAKTNSHHSRYETTIKIMHVLNLLFHKDGFKEGKNWCLSEQAAMNEVAKMFQLEIAEVKKTFSVFVDERLLSVKPDSYKNNCLTVQNRSVLSKFTEFLENFVKATPDLKSFPNSLLELLECIKILSEANAYTTFKVSLKEVIAEGSRRRLDTSSWSTVVNTLKAEKEIIQMLNIGTPELAFRIQLKDFPDFIKHHRILLGLDRAGINR